MGVKYKTCLSRLTGSSSASCIILFIIYLLFDDAFIYSDHIARNVRKNVTPFDRWDKRKFQKNQLRYSVTGTTFETEISTTQSKSTVDSNGSFPAYQIPLCDFRLCREIPTNNEVRLSPASSELLRG